MSIRMRRALLLSSSGLLALCFTGVALSQTPSIPAEIPETTPPPADHAGTVCARQQSASAGHGGSTATKAPASGRPRWSGQAGNTGRAANDTAGDNNTDRASTATQPTAVAASSVQANPSLNTITSNQIQASQAQSFGDLFFTLPGATSAGLAPGVSRPVLRGLDDFRVRVQENGIGSMDVSDYGQDHGVPIDPLAVQKIEIYRGPEALRFGSQAVGGIVEATNNRIPFAAPLGGWQTQFKAATSTVDRGLEGGALFDAGTRDFAVHANFYGRHGSDYFVPSYPYLFPPDPALPFNGKQPNSSLHSEGQAAGGS
jgi:iron complex outermembrane recepter protein